MNRPVVSIVMAYYERAALLKTTLASFKTLGYSNDVEVIIVDDGSIREPLAIDASEYEFRIKCIIIPSSKKRHINSCVPYDVGFEQANGDVVIIQNPECIHLDNIVNHALHNSNDTNYLSYSCYSLNEESTKRISENGWERERIRFHAEPRAAGSDGQDGWYNHSKYKPNAYHFCSAISGINLKLLGGFDARYAKGIGFDDDEFLYRVRAFPLTVKIVDDLSVLHQYHYSKRVYDKELERKMHANWVLYQFYTKNGQKRLRYAYYRLYIAFYSRGYARVAKLLRRLYPGFSSSLRT